MILRALYELAKCEGLTEEPDFMVAPVTWLVRISADGRILGIEDTRQPEAAIGKRKPKLVSRQYRIPRQVAKSGTKAPPNFFVDNAKYVFGLATADKPFSESEGEEKSGWFRELVADCATATGDVAAHAVLKTLEDARAGRQRVTLPADCASNHLFAFVYEPDVDILVHTRPAIERYWKARRAESLPGNGSGRWRCIVTGETIGGIGNFPRVKRIPGGQSAGAALVSFNAKAFESFGLDRNENAPISRAAAEACATALDRLVHPAFPHPSLPGHTLPRRSLPLTDDTLVCFWAAGSGADPLLDCFVSLLEVRDPEEVGEMYRGLWRGQPIALRDPAVFHALTLSGAQGRIIIRDWFESSVAEVAEHIAEHFADLQVVRATPPPKGRSLPEQLPLRVLMQSLVAPGRNARVPAPLASTFLQSALRGTAYPISCLQRAVERARAEIGGSEWGALERRDARASVIKAVLNRRRRLGLSSSDYTELTVTMDPTNTAPGYLLGRLMAVLERLQQAALGDINASVVDRYFASASASPRAVFTRLLKNARHHASKAKDDPRATGMAIWLERQMDEISARFDPKQNGFPAWLDLEQQGLFVLGYHQQRHWLRLSKEERERA